MNRGRDAGIDALDRGFRDGVGVFPEVVFDPVFVLADMVGPDGASILEMNDVAGAGSAARSTGTRMRTKARTRLILATERRGR